MKIELDLHRRQCFVVAPARYEGESCPELEWDNDKDYHCGKYNKAINKLERCKECLKDEEQ